MRILAAFLGISALSLVVSGCGPNRDVDLAQCRLEAARVYPRWSSDEYMTPAADFTYFCMQAKGYKISRLGTNTECPSNQGVVIQTTAGCYIKPRLWD